MKQDEKKAVTLAEARQTQVLHGNLIRAEWSWSRSGMAVMDHEKSVLCVEWTDDGVILTDRSEKGNGSFRECVYSVHPLIADKIRMLAERENLAAWDVVRDTEKEKWFVPDMSSSSDLTLQFRPLAGIRECRLLCVIDPDAVYRQGGETILKELRDLMKYCARPEYLIRENTKKGNDLFRPELPKTESGDTWICPVCGATGMTTRFCANCGSPRPKTE